MVSSSECGKWQKIRVDDLLSAGNGKQKGFSNRIEKPLRKQIKNKQNLKLASAYFELFLDAQHPAPSLLAELQLFFAEVPAALVGASFKDAFIAVPFLAEAHPAPSLFAEEQPCLAVVPAAFAGASFTDAFIAVPLLAEQQAAFVVEVVAVVVAVAEQSFLSVSTLVVVVAFASAAFAE